MTTQALSRAGFWPRLAATAIDYAIIASLCTVLGAILGGAFREDPYLGAAAAIVTGFTLVGALYMSLEAFTSATLGKRALHLMVVGEDGCPAPAGVRVSRYLVKNCHLLLGAAATVSGLWFVGALAPLATLVVVAGSTMILTSERRALHDLVAKTMVVSTRGRATRAGAVSS